MLNKRQFIKISTATIASNIFTTIDAFANISTTKIIVPYAAGGTTDLVARVVQNGISESGGRPFIVENKPGVNGVLGSLTAYNSKPDGSVIFVGGTDSNIIYNAAYRNPRYDSRKFVPIAPVGESPHILLSKPQLKLKNAGELIELSKKQSLTYATWGSSSSGNFAMTTLIKSAGMSDLLQVPYTSATQAIQAVMSGQVDLIFAPAPAAIAVADKTNLLCIFSNKRAPTFPNIPSLQEAGLNIRVDGSFWMGFFAPPDTPEEVAQELNKLITQAIKLPHINKKLSDAGLIPQTANLDEYKKFYDKEFDIWTKIVKDSGVILD